MLAKVLTRKPAPDENPSGAAICCWQRKSTAKLLQKTPNPLSARANLGDPASGSASAAAEVEAADASLPSPGYVPATAAGAWSKAIDSQGRVYYVNDSERLTSWVLPSGGVLAAGSTPEGLAAAAVASPAPGPDRDASGGAWKRVVEGGDVWFERGSELVWKLPEGATIEVSESAS